MQVDWIVACELPDAETIVLLHHPDESEPVWPGYWDGEFWRSAEGKLVEPTHWAEMPAGPDL